ncbi:MAG: hypothetical protein JXA42_03500 [Anaerolineales bacterium]|nr:hypothetical protein [Anaerolineales bacterium]
MKAIKLHIVVELYKTFRARLGRIALFTTLIGVSMPIILIGVVGDRRASTFPGIVGQLLIPSLTVLIGILSVLIAVSSWGDEYIYGTVRTVMSRCPARWQFMAGKTVAMGLALLAIITAAAITEMLVATGSHLVQSGVRDLGINLLSLFRILAPGIGIWWLGGMIYTGVVAAVTIGSRSPALGMAAGLGIFMADLIVGFLGLGSSGTTVSAYSISHNSLGLMTTFIDRWSVPGTKITLPAMEVATLPDPNIAMVRLVVFTVATLFLAFILFKKQDLV